MIEQNPIASIILPIRALEPNQREIERLERLMVTIPSSYEIVVVDDGSSHAVGRYLWSRLSDWKNYRQALQLRRIRTGHRRFSLARARNHGAKYAKAPVVIFHDVDFIGAASVYERIFKYIREVDLVNRPENFFCIPVAFLNEMGTQDFMTSLNREQEAWCFRTRKSWPFDCINFLVQGSSCMVLNRRDLLDMGGHDQGFSGHGAEDFELLHRLSTRFPIATRPPEYSRNMGSGNISEYRGFRAYFALYGEQARRKGCTLVHLWHPKRKEKGYYRHKQNFKKLQKILQSDQLLRGWRRWCQSQKRLTQGKRLQISPEMLWPSGAEETPYVTNPSEQTARNGS
ncbi:glycosyltransferase [Salinicola sp. CR57]|uniref:glycosyltransferase n=1 Tax=Salinicola sp. CR57 TaxID=1949086 RepID=UPI0013003DEC|nr:glycosyltransferase [Salinicola sp. CR57]